MLIIMIRLFYIEYIILLWLIILNEFYSIHFLLFYLFILVNPFLFINYIGKLGCISFGVNGGSIGSDAGVFKLLKLLKMVRFPISISI